MLATACLRASLILQLSLWRGLLSPSLWTGRGLVGAAAAPSLLGIAVGVCKAVQGYQGQVPGVVGFLMTISHKLGG